MDISQMTSDLQSVRTAIGMSVMSKAMNQDNQTLQPLLHSMVTTSSQALESSVTPYKGTLIDILA